MGKSLKNAVSPDEMYEAYGADTLRLYEMAMGPLDASRPWETRDVVGMYRFLQRLWRAMVDETTGELVVDDAPADDETRRLLHRTIDTVRREMDALRFNTAIAKLIELNNHVTKLAATPREVAEPLVLMLAPLVPHVAEELWQHARPRRHRDVHRVPGRRSGTAASTTPSSTRCRSTARCADASRSRSTPTATTVEAAALADAKVVGRDRRRGHRRR